MYSWKLCAKYECLESFSENSYFVRSGLSMFILGIFAYNKFQCIFSVKWPLVPNFSCIAPIVSETKGSGENQKYPFNFSNRAFSETKNGCHAPNSFQMANFALEMHWICSCKYSLLPYYIMSDLVCINLYQFRIISIAALIYILPH